MEIIEKFSEVTSKILKEIPRFGAFKNPRGSLNKKSNIGS